MDQHRAAALLPPIVALAVILGACSSGDETVASAPSSMPANDSGMMGDQRVGRFGEPAAASEADRVIEVEQFDLLRFEPTEIQVDLGETMRFDVTNVGSHDHEFVIGDESYQAAHGDDMSDDGHGAMQAMPNGVLVAPGATESFAWTFTEPGTFEFACHLPGHYEGGMKGRIIVAG